MMTDEKKYIVGIDIGGSKMRSVLWNGKKVLKFYEFDTPKNKRDFEKILNKFPPMGKVGIAVAGVVEGTKIETSPNIKYLKNFDFKDFLLRVKVDNDARAFLAAEAGGRKNVLGITVGTGIGRAISGKKIKVFEYPEKWEKKYQEIRDRKDYDRLADFLAGKINLMIKKYKVDAVILGGGVLDRSGFYKKLSKKLSVKTRRSRLGKKAGALGAALLYD